MKKNHSHYCLTGTGQAFPPTVIVMSVFLILIFFWGCGDRATEPIVPSTHKVEPDQAVDQSLVDLIQDVEYIQLQLPQGEYFGVLRKVKMGHTYRYIYTYNDTVSVVPMYDRGVYRVFEEGDEYSVMQAYKFDFGKYWIDEEILANSYDDRLSFFESQQEYVHTT